MNATLTWANDPFFIGWDKVLDRFNDLSKTNATAFPPYNVRQINEDTYAIDLAIAGYNKSMLKITEENGTLTVEGVKPEDSENYVYRGIAGRKFTRSFSLAEHIYVTDAHMQDGILVIGLKRNVPDELKPREIEITNFSEGKPKK